MSIVKRLFVAAVFGVGVFLFPSAVSFGESPELAEEDMSYALEFDGSGDYVALPIRPSDIDDGPITFSCRIKIAPGAGGDRMKIFSSIYDRTENRWDFEYNESGGRQLEFNEWGGHRVQPGNQRLEEGVWYFVSFVWEPGEKVTLYIDGEKDAELEIVRTSLEDGGNFRIAGRPDESEKEWEGNIKDARLWQVARTGEEIRDGMQNPPTGDEDGLVGYWPMNEGSGDVIEDLTGDNDGRFVGDLRWVPAAGFKNDLADEKDVSPGETVTLGPVEFHEPHGEVTYHWYLDGEPIEGAGESTLTLNEVTFDELGTYHVELTDDDRYPLPVESNRKRLPEWPLWESTLSGESVSTGDSVTLGPVELYFSSGDVTYQWYFGGEPIEGATASTLEIDEITEDDLGTYYVVVDDAQESTPFESPRVQLHDFMTFENDGVTFGTDGSWCWYQDERAIIDNGTLLFSGVSSVGDITVTAYDFETGESERVILHERLQADDHNVPGLMVRPDGKYLAAYTGHNIDSYVRYRVSKEPGNPLEWEPEERVDLGHRTCYSNLYYLEDEDLTYNFHRSRGMDPNYLISEDYGDTWEYGGKLHEFPARYSSYPRYTTNERDEIHFITTESHPRDFANSVYHGYIKDGMVYHSDGTPVGELSTTSDTDISPTDLTMVFEGDEDNIGWTNAIELDDEGHPYIGYSVTKDRIRRGAGGYDHRYRYARWDGNEWHDYEIAYAGTRLYPGEDAYTGLIEVHPGNPDIVYISADVDPRTGEALISEADGNQRYEIFKGVTEDRGANWAWIPITENSPVDNIRPIVAVGDNYRAVLWLRGRYSSMHNYDLDVVGLFSHMSD